MKPGGVLITYTGQFNFPEVWKALTAEESLDYFWIAVLVGPRAHNEVMARRIHNLFKPLLIFVKPPYVRGEWRNDAYIPSDKREKELHE